MTLKNQRQDLSFVHSLIAAERYDDAVAVLSKLREEHPDFLLYGIKLEQYKKKLSREKSDQAIVSPAKSDKKFSFSANDITDRISRAAGLAKIRRTAEARTLLTELLNAGGKNSAILVELARLDLIDGRYNDALHKAKSAIQNDKQCRDAYRIAEQASIELGMHSEANNYFLSQPPVTNPPAPRARGANPALPKQFVLPPVHAPGNDYRHILAKSEVFKGSNAPYELTVSIIIPVYNRNKILANTLAALTHQTYPKHLTEIIVVDDGSDDNVLQVIEKYESKLNIFYLRQPDRGFRVAAARNMGLRQAKGDAIIFLDADILPCPTDVETYMTLMHVSDETVLIGHRRYVDVANIDDDMILRDINVAITLPSINPNNDVADRKDLNGASIDWRYPLYEATRNLIDDPWPFTKGAAGNLCFSRKLIEKAGYVDEDFQAWGCEDIEHCYRLYNAGAYFIPVLEIESLHQEPLSQVVTAQGTQGESFRAKGHKITKELFSKKCPAPVARQYPPGAIFDIPKVSIYIPAYNAASYILDAVKSCLEQNYGDLEVCICDDGSTDNTLQLLEKHYSNNKKVRWVTQKNGGIGKATNTAISMCRGMYIAQLDADDRLKKEAVRTCVSVLDSKNVEAVYTDCDYIDEKGNYIRDGWCGGEFSREWMATGMIATHFRMFRKRVWSRIPSCNEGIKNAVDLDLWLKIYERGNIEHIHQILYSYRWHGANTSIMHRKHQEANHLKVVNDSLERLKLADFWMVKSTDNPLNPREFTIQPTEPASEVRPEDVVFLIPTCLKYADKADAVRNTWAKRLKDYGFRYFFILGNPELDFPKVVGDTLHVPCKDDYETLLLKLVLGYEFLYSAVDFKYVYKIDDDCLPDLEAIIGIVLPQLRGQQYVGGATHPKGAKMNNKWHFGKCSDPRFDKPYRFDVAPFEFAKGGYGYFLRSDTLPALIKEIPRLKNELVNHEYSFEDVRIAEIFNTAGIPVKKLEKYTVSPGDKGANKDSIVIYDIKSGELMYEIVATQMN